MRPKRTILKSLDSNGDGGEITESVVVKKHTDFSIKRILNSKNDHSGEKDRQLFYLNNPHQVFQCIDNLNSNNISSYKFRQELIVPYFHNQFPLNQYLYNPFLNVNEAYPSCHLNYMYPTSTNTSHILLQQSNSAGGIVHAKDEKPNGLPLEQEDCSICNICYKVFSTEASLKSHIKTHKTPRYECAVCGKGFSQLRNYKYHVSVHNGTKEFAAKCPECDKVFNDKGYLSSHLKIHRNRKEYVCPHCPKSFNQRVAFNMHIRIHTGVKPHKCMECGKRFSRKMLLKQHLRTHSGEKPYQCSVCEKTFADRSNMTLHTRLHSGIKPFECPICPKAFTKKHHLKTHLNYHTGHKPYLCPKSCGQSFTQSSNMRTHAKKCLYLQESNPMSIVSTNSFG